MTRLNELDNLLVREGKDVNKCVGEFLNVAIGIAGAKKGNIQLYDLDLEALIIAAQSGFHDFFLRYFEQVRNDGTACSQAMQSREQIVVEDVKNSEIFIGTPAQNLLLIEDVRAVISTPLISSTEFYWA